MPSETPSLSLVDTTLESPLQAPAFGLDNDARFDAAVLQTAAESEARRKAIWYTALSRNPDEFAKTQRLAERSGLPPEVVERNYGDVFRRAATREALEKSSGIPVLNGDMFLGGSAPQAAHLAVLVQDDLDRLSGFERTVHTLKALPAAVQAGGQFLSAGLKGATAAGANVVSAGLSGPLARLGVLDEDYAAQFRDWEAAGGQADRAGVRQTMTPTPETYGAYGPVLSGIQSLPTSIAALLLGMAPGGQPLAVGLFTGAVGGEAYLQGLERGKGQLGSTLFGATQGMIEGATEAIPLARFLKSWQVKQNFGQLLRGQLAAEIPGEQLATFFQDATEWLSLNPDATLGQFLAARPGAAADTLVATLVGTSVQTGAVYPLTRFLEAQGAAQDAQRHAGILQALAELTKATKLQERSPTTFGEYTAAVLAQEGVGINDIYLDAQALTATLQQAGVPLDDVLKLSPSIREQLAEAQATQGSITIPAAEYAGLVSGTPLDALLLQHVRTAEDGMSLAEAQLFQQVQAQAFADEVERITEDKATADAREESARVVHDQFRAQLDALGRHDAKTREVQATLASALYRTVAERTGQTAEELLAKVPLQVQSTTGQGTQTLEQEEPADAFFAPAAMQQAKDLLGAWKSRETLVYLSPADFLALAERIDAPVPEKLDPINARLDAGEPFESLPFLNFENDDAGSARVVGHEGRHRAYALQARGVERIPVVLRSTGGRAIRWGQQDNAASFDRVKVWPRELVGEDKTAHVPFPVRDPLGVLEQSAPGSDIGHRREKTSGRYVGAPDWVGKSPQQLAQLRKKLKQLALEGERGRFWYERSSRAILDLVGGDKVEAEKIVSLIAIYSPNATVPANTVMALTAYFQWKAGAPIQAGFKAANKKAEDLLRHDKAWKGIKTNSFYQNLMVEIDPTKLEPGVATMDMWMALAFDYGMTKLDQGPKYRFAERETQRLAAELGWKAHQVQAAIWVAMKSRVDPIRKKLQAEELKRGIGEMRTDSKGKETYRYKPKQAREHFHLAHRMGMEYDPKLSDVNTAKTDFADTLQTLMAQLSWEATPSTATGRSLPGIHQAPLAQKAEYLHAVRAALTENGRDVLADLAGLPPGNTVEGFSAWLGDVGAGAQTFVAVPLEGAVGKRHIKPIAADLLDLYANLMGYVLEQDAVVYHVPVWDDSIKRRNGVQLTTARPLSADEMRLLYQALHDKFGTWDLAPGFRPDGVRVLNFVEGLDNKAFQAGFQEVVESLPEDFGGGNLEHAFFRSDGNYLGNNWTENPNGEEYLDRVVARRPDLQQRAASLRARVQAVNGFFERRYGWDRPGQPSTGTLFQSDGGGRGDDRGGVQGAIWGSVPRYAGGQAQGAVSAPAIHFSGDTRTELDSAKWGTGMRDAAAARVANSPDPRLRHRIYFYLDNGRGISSESGVGYDAHAVFLDNLYDAVADPLDLRTGRTANEFESAVLDAGFDGVVNSVGSGPSAKRAAVLLGERKVPVKAIGYEHQANAALAALREPQPLEQGARGAYDLSTATITLLENADLSTFVHELGHHALEMLVNIASAPNAPADVVADVQAVLDWFGVPDLATWQGMDLEARRPYHETFARGFEAYLFEGNAPAAALRDIFRRVRSWMLQVYKSLTGLNVQLTDDVRRVFDRLLASEEMIREAQAQRDVAALFRSAEEAGMTPEEWQAYQAENSQVTRDAVDYLADASMRDMKWLSNARNRTLKKLQKEAAELRAAVRQEVTTRALQEPVYAAQVFLSRGDLPEDPTRNQAQRRILELAGQLGSKLDLGALKAMYGEDPAAVWRYLPTGRRGLAAEQGLHPDMVAELFGFSSGDELVRALVAAEPMTAWIDGQTDQLMLERYGELNSPEALSEEVNRALHNEARGKFIATELRALTKMLGSPRMLQAAAKMFAQNIVDRKKLVDLKPSHFMANERRADRQARDALKGNDLQAAANAKRTQLLNHYAVSETYDVLRQIEKDLGFLKKLDRPNVRKKIGKAQMDQIDALLERIDLRKSVPSSQAEAARRQSLAEWIASMEEQGFDPIVDDALRNETFRKPYRELTVAEWRGFVDAVRNIAHLGRAQQKLLTAIDKAAFDAAVAEISQSIRDNANRTQKKTLEHESRLRVAASHFLAIHRKVPSIVREMDGGKDGGTFWNYFVRPMNARGDFEAAQREQATVALTQLFEPLFALGKLGEKVFIPEINDSLSREARLVIALNWGNETNRKRVLDGFNWSLGQAQAVLSHLTKGEWDFVQSVWDYLDTFWPEIKAKEERVTGVAPQRVEHATISTPFGQYRGGYYPIAYDRAKSTQAYGNAVEDIAKQMMRGAAARASTRRGHTQARVATVRNRPLDLSLGTVFRHVDQVIHDLAWHEWLIDANRLLRAPDIDAAIRDHYGDPIIRTMIDAVRDIAVGEVPAQNALESALNHLRTGATIAGMGYNLMTSLLQPLGLTQSMARIGVGPVARGLGMWLGDAVRMESTVGLIYEKSTFMRLRGKTLQREINEIANRVRAEGKFSAFQHGYFYLIQKMQLVADVPTWLGMYHKALEQGVDEAKAIAMADQAVLDSQGGGQVKDLADVQRGSPMLKLWTNFYSYFNVTYNLMAESYRRTNFRHPAQVAEFAVDMLLLTALPATLAVFLRAAVQGGGDDDWESFAKKIAKENVTYLLGLMVGVRELSAAAGGVFGYTGPAGTRFFSELAKLSQQVQQGDIDKPLLRAALATGGILFHLPATQVQHMVDGYLGLANDRTDNPLALLTGMEANVRR